MFTLLQFNTFMYLYHMLECLGLEHQIHLFSFHINIKRYKCYISFALVSFLQFIGHENTENRKRTLYLQK